MYGPRMLYGPIEPPNEAGQLTVDADLLRSVLADPDWTRRVVVAAAKTLNTLAFYSDDSEAQRRDFRHPNAEAIPARQMLFHAFVTDQQLIESLQRGNPS